MKKKKLISFHPIMAYIILIIGVILLSAFLSLIGVDATYNRVNPNTGEYVSTLVMVKSLLSITGMKYIFSSTVNYFVNFTPFSMLLIALIGIGIMEKSGFLKTLFTILTRNIKKTSVTFYLILVCIMSSIIGDISFVVLIPLSALLFLHGKRNPIVGIITAFASLACGFGINIFFTASDSSLLNLTLEATKVIDPSYHLGVWSWLFIMSVTVIGLTFLLTNITERLLVPKLGKYELNDDPTEVDDTVDAVTEEDKVIDTFEKRGLKFSLIGGISYLLIVLYTIIPTFLPFSGILLDDSQKYYIDKLFSSDSFFSAGFVLIVSVFFVICGLLYGIGAKTIKSNKDFCDNLGHSLDGIGKILILMLFSSIFINIFKYSNIGVLIVAKLGELFSILNFGGLALIIALFIIVAVSSLLVPNSVTKWSILASFVIPSMISAGFSPEYTQFIYTTASGATAVLTPIYVYFIVYLAWLEKYNQDEKPIGLFKAIKYQAPYSFLTLALYLIIIIVAYIIRLPIGLDGGVFL